MGPRFKTIVPEESDLIVRSASSVSSWPEAKDLLRGKTFVRYLH
jgi:hypothetical protein